MPTTITHVVYPTILAALVAYVVTLQPTFTQGFILGQLSILFLLALVLKYLFLDSSATPAVPPSFAPLSAQERGAKAGHVFEEKLDESVTSLPLPLHDGTESAEWFNLILHEVFNSYRQQLRDNVRGDAGNDIARTRIQRYLNEHRGSGLIDPIVVNAVSLGHSAPKLSNAHIIPRAVDQKDATGPQIRIEATYTDTVSLGLSTSVCFNQPVPGFARLPVSLSVALNFLRATILIFPPAPDDPEPTLTLQLQPDVELSLHTNSLFGLRAKLENVSKVHELLENRIRRALVERGTWRIHLPLKKT
ncbi:hypothetical protein PIIN_08742 [Serendipita indica DSM 11827]|uniref:SMP-LTD domain-containing protein n=1 Tax=Serendipita indica (strain DSM 11827) TaxID=1109443 RepID=G4U2W0_SERID|nr:hypothetical protein PIIN_08742 [Serendipita indica DSM 11827]